MDTEAIVIYSFSEYLPSTTLLGKLHEKLFYYLVLVEMAGHVLVDQLHVYQLSLYMPHTSGIKLLV